MSDEHVPTGDRRGIDPGVLAVMRALHADFVESHLREHEQADHARAVIEAERDKRTEQRFDAQEKAVATAARSAKEGVDAAFASNQQAIEKSERGVEKRSDSVYVTLEKLGISLSDVMPRKESEGNVAALHLMVGEVRKTYDASLAELRKNYDVVLAGLADRVKGLEAVKAGGKETLTGVYALAGFILTILVIAGMLAATGAFKGGP